MKINLLLSLGLALVSALHALPTASDKKAIDNLQKLAGKWNSIFLASTVQKRVEDGGDMKFSINNIDVRGHDVVFDLDLQEDGKCIPYIIVANKTEKDNVLKFDYEGENTVYVEKANPDDHVIFATHNIQNGTETVVLELYGRSQDVKENAKKSFKKLCKKYGINKDYVIDMTQNSKCNKEKQ
ncbi:epididymal-specific lipocalin-9 [Trichosurus vulpecula]|uniref:epididymal-specific lipocalin-9 n=1 Tax=Trichosurus vulpecula TaxID=9337 RepID=UPI00186B502B|nr:epididymal-specific lipocalin-9 [Trichosurus vulpecula]